MAFDCAETGGTLPAVFNAANEEAVALFLRDRIGFLDIYDLIGNACHAHHTIRHPAIVDIFAAEEEARAYVRAHGGNK